MELAQKSEKKTVAGEAGHHRERTPQGCDASDRERAVKAIRRGAPIGTIVTCGCFADPQTRSGCVGVCEETVAAIMASYAEVRAADHEKLRAALEEMLAAHSMENVGVDASMRRLNAKKRAREVLKHADD